MAEEPATVSVCLPLYKAEKSLSAALDSVLQAAKGFDGWEIVVANDNSPGLDLKGKNGKKIVQAFRKKWGLKKSQIVYIEHSSNLGLLETRRSLVQAASGQYIAMLDADDQLLPGALSALYMAAQKSGADIVHGQCQAAAEADQSTLSRDDESPAQKRAQYIQKTANSIFFGQLLGPDIFDGFLVRKNHSGFLWGKLIRRSVYLEALNSIPFSRLVFAEDFLQYFFISRTAKKYLGVQEAVYRYNVDTGISSFAKITSLERWEQICSAANVFAIIFSAAKEEGLALSPEQGAALRLQSRSYLANNLKQLKEAVAPELQEEARTLLCEYWGEDFVRLAESHL